MVVSEFSELVRSLSSRFTFASANNPNDADPGVKPLNKEPASTPKVLLEAQSYVLPGKERIHVSILSKDKPEDYQKSFVLYNDVKTLYDLIRRGRINSKNGNCLGWRPDDKSSYQWISYESVINRSVNFGRGLRHLGQKEKDFIGIYSKNRVEWVVSDLGIISFSMSSVPLYDTLGPDACHFIISQVGITTVVVECEKNLLSILGNVPPCLENIIYVEEISSDIKKRTRELGLKLYQFQEIEKIGESKQNWYSEKPPKPDDIAFLCYTSGTTGVPKGVIITHDNYISNVGSTLSWIQHSTDLITKDDVLFSLLPLAHIYERVIEGVILLTGASIGFSTGDPLKLLDDIQALRPTFLPCVPRVLNRIYDKVMTAAGASTLKRLIFNTAFYYKGREVQRGLVRRDSFWDKLVFQKVQDILGGRIRVVMSGGAPISNETLHFFRCSLGCTVLEGYGQTEVTAAVTITHPNEIKAGHVGPPVPCAAIKLIDVPEMNYFAANDEGEICVRGPLVSRGYYKNPEETEKTFDKDGWMHTGDIGTWLPNGVLRVIDRKKHIFKLSQGEYVAPEKIELVYLRCPSVSQIFVYGDSLESYLVGIVVPDPESFKSLYPNSDMRTICSDPKTKTLILNEMTGLGKQAGLQSFEQVKDIYLHPSPFTLEQGLLTPTMKSKRSELQKFFLSEIRKMYAR